MTSELVGYYLEYLYLSLIPGPLLVYELVCTNSASLLNRLTIGNRPGISPILGLLFSRISSAHSYWGIRDQGSGAISRP